MIPEQLLEITNLLPEAVLLVSGEGRILAANRGAVKRLGCPAAELHGQPLADLCLTPSETLRDYLLACSRTREPHPGTLVLTVRGGEALRCRCEGSVLQPRRGDRPALLLLRLFPTTETPSQFALLNRQIADLTREIGRRRQVEQVLRDQREWLQVTLSSIGDAVIATDAEGRVLFMNPVAQRLTAWSQDAAAGQPIEKIFRVVNEHTREPVASPVDRVLREGEVVGLANHTLLIARDGTEWPIDDSGAPIRDAEGKLFGVVLTFREIVERHRMEAELRRQSEDLREANRRKDEFLAMLAHELRNPLGALRNALYVLRHRRQEEPAYIRALGVAERQVEHQARMVDDLLDVSRLTRRSFELRMENLELSRLVRQVVEDCRQVVENEGLHLKVNLPEVPVLVYGDAVRLSQVLVNLLNNAVKFSHAGGTITVSITPSPDPGAVLLKVVDTGIGISPDLLPNVFESFVQGEQSLARSRGGLGLGLSLVKGIVELHGGRVSAESAGEGRGSSFSITLPTISARETVSRGETASSVSAAHRILVIDDLVDAATTLGDLLEAWGHEVELAYDGLSAVETARRFVPDVVLCDLGLPGIDGFEVARRLRAQSETTGAVLVALTGYGREEDRLRSQEAGFDHHLTKPADADKLQRLLAAARRR